VRTSSQKYIIFPHSCIGNIMDVLLSTNLGLYFFKLSSGAFTEMKQY